MRSTLATTTTTIMALAASAALAGPTGGQAHAADGTAPTHFAMHASGFGTRVQGGELPAGSGSTAFESVGCTNRAGVSRDNHLAEVDVPGLGGVAQATTRTWTTARSGVVSSYSRNSIERVVIGDDRLGTVEIEAITSLSRAFHDATGFHSATSTDIGSITYTDPAGATSTEQRVPTPDRPLVIPGLATISVGSAHRSSGPAEARAAADAIEIDLLASGSRARIAHSAARIDAGIVHGVFRGFSSAVRATGLAGVSSVGYQPLSLMPCQGTRGKVRTKAVATLDVGAGLVLSGVASEQMGKQSQTMSRGYERGSVDSLDLGDGQLVVDSIIGKATVERTSAGIVATALGTGVGEVLVNGEKRAFEPDGTLEIPGVALLERSIVTRSTTGIFVTALRLTMLDGSGAVVDLGQARLNIRSSGL